MNPGIALAERGLIPDAWIRSGIRRLDRIRLEREARGGVEAQSRAMRRFIDHLHESPVALDTECPRAQHYELPPAFFQRVLGRHMKYSSGLWPEGVDTLDAAEESMLELYAQQAVIHVRVSGSRSGRMGAGRAMGLMKRIWTSPRYRSSNPASQ